jgi:hypothetical protein
LLLLAVAVHARGSTLAGVRTALLVGMVLAICLVNIRLAAVWDSYRSKMATILATERGFVPVETTALDRNPCRWAWTSPELSVVWSYPVVRAIVENRVNEPFAPFNPHRRLILKRYVRYDAVFAEVDPTARLEPAPR